MPRAVEHTFVPAAVFPVELERDIFELTARSYPETSIKLALVAWRVQFWIEKLIYEVVVLSDRQKCTNFLRTIDSRPPLFFDAVKSLCLSSCLDKNQVSRILLVCRKVEDLGFWAPCDTAELHAGSSRLPRPRRLSVNVKDVFRATLPDFRLSLFANITHLRIVDGWMSWITWHGLHLIPHLTHLAIDFSGVTVVHLPRVAPSLHYILNTCSKLEVCLLYTHECDLSKTRKSLRAHNIVDCRVVLLAYANPQEEWAHANRRSHSLAHQWLDAENVVSEQKLRLHPAT